MSRQIIFYENYFLDFYAPLKPSLKDKIQYVLELIKQIERVPEKF